MVVPQAAAQNTNMSQHLRMIIATFNVEHVLVQAAQSTPGASLSDRSDREVVLGCCLHKGCGNMSGVTIEQRSGLGNVLVATKEFQPREAVVQERPLLHVPQLKPSNPLYKPLQAYFEQHKVPPSVVLKIMAFVTASSATQASVLRCFCPDVTAYEDAAVVQQARAFAACLLQHPPVPEFAEWASSCSAQETTTAAAGEEVQAASTELSEQSEASDSAVGTAAERKMQQQHPNAFDMLMRVWLIWVMNGHSFKLGSALFEFGSKLTHTCACPSTMYRTAAGDISAVVESVDGSSGSSNSSSGALQQALPSGGPPVIGGGAAAAGAHLALQHIVPDDLLTTNYLGMGHKRIMSTPARQSYLQDKFLFKCICHRCTAEVDLARGIPCPSCSGPFRSDDKLLSEQEALLDWQVGQPLTVSHGAPAAAASGMNTSTSRDASSSTDATSSSTAAGPTAGALDGSVEQQAQSSSSSSSSRCGYIYCDMAALLAGAAEPWKCDVCGAAFANDTSEVWGRFYTKLHHKIESDMEGWVMRLDESMDAAPLVRDPSVLHERVLSVVRLLGPRHWASWRLLLLGVELHCGALEEASIRAQLKLRNTSRQASKPTSEPAAADAGAQPEGPSDAQQSSSGSGGASAKTAHASRQASESVQASEAAGAITQLAVLIVRYCRQLWAAVSGAYGEVEAGQVLGYHFSEACQVLLQVSSTPGLWPQQTANALVEAALQLQLLVLPGVRNIMGPEYNPLSGLLGQDSLAGSQPGVGGNAAAVAAAIRRQQQQRAADANQMTSLVQELKKLEAAEGV